MYKCILKTLVVKSSATADEKLTAHNDLNASIMFSSLTLVLYANIQLVLFKNVYNQTEGVKLILKFKLCIKDNETYVGIS